MRANDGGRASILAIRVACKSPRHERNAPPSAATAPIASLPLLLFVSMLLPLSIASLPLLLFVSMLLPVLLRLMLLLLLLLPVLPDTVSLSREATAGLTPSSGCSRC